MLDQSLQFNSANPRAVYLIECNNLQIDLRWISIDRKVVPKLAKSGLNKMINFEILNCMLYSLNCGRRKHDWQPFEKNLFCGGAFGGGEFAHVDDEVAGADLGGQGTALVGCLQAFGGYLREAEGVGFGMRLAGVHVGGP